MVAGSRNAITIDRIPNSSRQNRGPLSIFEHSPPASTPGDHYPPPSPVPGNNSVAALQTAADASSIPFRPSCSRSVAALQFSGSTKRRPSAQRSGTYTDTNSPVVYSDALANLQVAADYLLLHHSKSNGKPSMVYSFSPLQPCTARQRQYKRFGINRSSIAFTPNLSIRIL
jgi:hypothetical protein